MKYFQLSKIFNSDKNTPTYEPLSLTDDQIDYYCRDMDLNALHPVIRQKLNFLTRLKSKPTLPDKFDAVINVDMQKEFAKIGPIRDFLLADRRGNIETEAVAQHAGQMIKAFRASGTPIYSIYTANRPRHFSMIDFYGYSYDILDKLVQKNTNSAFQTAENDFAARLDKHGHKNLLFAGFNTCACVKETIYDALKKGYKPWLMIDCTGDDNINDRELSPEILRVHKNVLLLEMHRKGVEIITSAVALQHIRSATPRP